MKKTALWLALFVAASAGAAQATNPDTQNHPAGLRFGVHAIWQDPYGVVTSQCRDKVYTTELGSDAIEISAEALIRLSDNHTLFLDLGHTRPEEREAFEPTNITKIGARLGLWFD